MSLIIRLAAVGDANDLYDLNREWEGDSVADVDMVKELLIQNNEIVLIAIQDLKPIGFICGKIVRSICHRTAHGEISELFVSKKYRKQGIARKLIEFMEQILKEESISIITINTSVTNNAAQQCYHNCGYIDKPRLEFRKCIKP